MLRELGLGFVVVLVPLIVSWLAYLGFDFDLLRDRGVNCWFLIAFVVLVLTMGFRGVFSSSLHYMLPRKRPCEGVVVEEGEADKNNSFPKKNRIAAAGTADSTVNSDRSFSSSSNNNNGSNNSGNPLEGGASVMALGDSNPPDIDEDLHSRQLAVYGRETMRRLFGSSVLISGMQGLGVEIAKNLILVGVKSVTLHDQGTVELWDLSSNFVFSKKDVGKNRAVAFCDFGPEFTAFDVHGEEPHTGIIAFINNDNPTLVSCVDDERLEFRDGDLVVFSEVHGMKELNDGKLKKAKDVRARLVRRISREEEDLYAQKLFAKMPQSDANIFLFFPQYSFVSFNFISWFQFDIG